MIESIAAGNFYGLFLLLLDSLRSITIIMTASVKERLGISQLNTWTAPNQLVLTMEVLLKLAALAIFIIEFLIKNKQYKTKKYYNL